METELLSGKGRVIFNELEGGFYAILGDDGNRFDPHPMLEGWEDGTRVRYEVRTKPGSMCFHMWGKIVEIITIQSLAD